ncbi:hypothetical protein [Pseudarthrobacter cellobiosi]|uniref:hypothetical protein n=1 Tax=Pseudarthrobacter cellobiosi TaxID=2953654 RepID=UPI00208F85A8|nr:MULTISPECIES: hypothetical protein [unclassified Pseudarthrobacter]MCO4255080.1 hypothetical protein [Pseudarthrobacter sp. HLT1-5]MCO4275214.1 hypothetical protein [Pseudarthrobacter sp. HLT3-5]
MGFDSSEPEQRRRLQAALAAAQVSTGDLWLYYFGIGGSVGEYEVEAYMQGLLSLPELQRDLLAMAANELSSDQPGPRAPFADELGSGDPARPEDS